MPVDGGGRTVRGVHVDQTWCCAEELVQACSDALECLGADGAVLQVPAHEMEV